MDGGREEGEKKEEVIKTKERGKARGRKHLRKERGDDEERNERERRGRVTKYHNTEAEI